MNYSKSLIFLLIGMLWSGLLYAQIADSIGIHANVGWFRIHAPSSSDSDEVKAFINAFPEEPQQGLGFGGFLDYDVGANNAIGFGVTHSEGSVDINETADPENTPDDESDDITILDSNRQANSVVFFLKTISGVTLGAGIEDGTFRFNTIEASGNKDKRSFNFKYPYYHLSWSSASLTGGGLYIAFVFHVLNATLAERGNFSGATFAIAIGGVGVVNA